MQSLQLVDPGLDDETYRAFSDLYPKNIDYRADGYLLFGAADEEDMAVGAMAVRMSDYAYDISWIYVDPTVREQGVGTFLMRTFLRFVEESMTFCEVEMAFSSNKLDLLYFLYSLEEFSLSRIGTEYRIRSVDEAGRIMQKLLKQGHHVDRWDDAVSGWRVTFLEKVAEEGIYTPMVSNWEDSLVPDLCLVKQDGGQITAAILVAALSDRELEIQLLYSENQKDTIEVLAAVCQRWQESYADYGICLTAVNEASRKMVTTLFPYSEQIGYKYLASWNYT